jgi:glutamate synthase domain-containing protein 2
VPDLAMAGGFSDETHVFKALALGAPNFKAVCMGRALMIPGMVGKNIGEWIKEGTLPKTVSKFGTKVDEIFVSYEELRLKYGKEIEKLPLGAIGIYTASQKIRTGLQQLMAGSRNFNLSTITRRDLMSLTEECEKVTGIPYVMRAYRKEAEKILAQ